ncbi:MAG TPA: hypothetical protein VJ844_02385 [Mucilaginibacter sp.]|nr:hypothetical protein [Mucilaginibacter sp.]
MALLMLYEARTGNKKQINAGLNLFAVFFSALSPLRVPEFVPVQEWERLREVHDTRLIA